MKKLHLMGLAALLAAPLAHGGEMPKGSFGAFYSLVDTTADDGDGFGIRGWANVSGPWFVHGEYAMLGLDDSGADVDELRIGGGMMGEIQPGANWLAKAEYIDLGGDASSDGFGVHGGVKFNPSGPIGFFGTLGYLMMSSDVEDSDGLELNVGAKMAFSKEWSGVVDYRTFMGETDSGLDDDFDEIRLGANYSFY